MTALSIALRLPLALEAPAERSTLPSTSGSFRRSTSTVNGDIDEIDNELDDLAWVARVREGDEAAARILVDRLYPTIIKTVRYRLPRRTSEEDLVQAIYAKIFAHLDQFSGTVPLEHWVSRIAVNTCLNHLKHERVRPELRMSDLREEEEAIVLHLLCTTDHLGQDQTVAAREVLEKMLARLRPDERLVITLLHLEERTVKEISRLTGWSVTLVKVKAFRSRQKMRKLWRSLAHERR
jgi:RNA polymerase sigma-70 factor (ECF subfamily)